MKFRPLKAEEIECRVGTVNENGVSLLLYKDARCDMNILDETVGCENWTRGHEVVNGNLFCNVGIKIPKDDKREFAEWVFKQDVGTESQTEKEKGEASDSFKRACFNWGIGRELYTAPFIWIPFEKGCVTKKIKNNKTTTYDKFEVEKIVTEKGIITGLAIRNTSLNKRVFVFKKG